MAPFHRRRIGKGPLRFARSLQLLGAVEHVVLTDRPQILTGGASDRRALRRVVQMIQTDTDWDWFELPLAADQGWFEPNWIDASSPASRSSCRTVAPIGRDGIPDNLVRSVGARRICESLRHARNRLNRGAAWRIEVVSDPADFDAAVERMMALHGRRAAIRDTVAHADVFAHAVDRDFPRDALVRMAGERRAEALFVNVDGRHVAGLMTLLTPTCVSMCFSGVEPDWWSYSAVTLLQWEAVRRAVAAGRTYADFSVGVDVAKLRWSEKVSIHPEFVVVSGRRRSEIAFGAYFVAAAAARAMRARPVPRSWFAAFRFAVGGFEACGSGAGIEPRGVLEPVPRPLRVTMVCNGYLPHFGGLETHVAQLVDALARAGAVVEVLTQETDRGLPAVETNGAVTVRRFRSVVPSQPRRAGTRALGMDRAAAIRLRRDPLPQLPHAALGRGVGCRAADRLHAALSRHRSLADARARSTARTGRSGAACSSDRRR